MTGLRSPSRDTFETGRFLVELSLDTDRFVRQLAAVTRLPHLTSDTPLAPTRQDTSMPDLAPCRFGIPGCPCSNDVPPTPTPEEPPATETSPAVQYGTKKNGVVRWPDGDNDLHFPDFGYVAADDLDELQDAAERTRGVTLVQRSVTYGPVEDVKPPLPTTPGSVVRARLERRDGVSTFGLTADTDEMPWREVGEGGAYYQPDELLDVTVVFDAGVTA